MHRNRTNIYIEDEETWASLMSKKVNYNLKSASEYIFSLLEMDQKRDIFVKMILEEIEKVREYVNYDLEDIAQLVGFQGRWRIQKIVDKIAGTEFLSMLQSSPTVIGGPEDRDLQFSDERSGSSRISIDLLHEEMIGKNMVPRESVIRNGIESYHNTRGRNTDMYDIVRMIYPNVDQRRMEIYYSMCILPATIKKLVNAAKNGKEIQEIDPVKEMAMIGYETNERELQGDLVNATILDASQGTQVNFKNVYGMTIRIATNNLILHHLKLVLLYAEDYSLDTSHVTREINSYTQWKEDMNEKMSKFP